MPLRPSGVGGSGAFLVLADDGRRYWCKPLNNLQSPRVTITEQIVARLGALISAPVCEPRLVRLDAIAGWEFRPGTGRLVEVGWAHGSVAVDPALETRSLEHRAEDDNRKRHSGIYALCDWLAGSDVQWLYATDQDNAYYSHDHGFFLTGPDWTTASLAGARDGNFAISVPPDGLDPAALAAYADALEAVTREGIEAELSKLPLDWPVSEEELLAVRDFAEHRVAPTVGRLRGLLA